MACELHFYNVIAHESTGVWNLEKWNYDLGREAELMNLPAAVRSELMGLGKFLTHDSEERNYSLRFKL